MTLRLPPFFSEPVEIGRGRFGVVYRVRQQGVGRWIALKSLPASAREEAEAEARHLATLDVPVLPAVYGVHVHRGRVFVAEEWLQGPSLEALLESGLGDEVGAVCASGICLALASLHAAGVAHGDLKPANILWTVDGRIRLVDLGMARGRASASGAQGGSPAYLAPELLAGGETDPIQADLWALGVVLHELLTGARPSPQDHLKGLPRLERTALGAEDSSLVKALLSQDPRMRPSALEVGIALASHGEDQAAARLLSARLFARQMADRLHEAGRLLLRQDPALAFAMLSEALDHDPDHVASLELLPRLRLEPRRGGKTIAGIALGCLVLAGAGAACLWRTAPVPALAVRDPLAFSAPHETLRVASTPRPEGEGPVDLPLRDQEPSRQGLGIVRFEGFPAGSRLRLGEELDSLEASSVQRRLRPGRLRIEVGYKGRTLHCGFHEILDYQTLVIRPDGVGKDEP